MSVNDYEVLNIDQLTRANDRHQLEPYYRAQIRSRGGTVLYIDISEADFTPERSAAILKEKANRADKIKIGQS